MRGLKPPQKRPRSITALSADLQRLRPPVDLSPYATKQYVDDAVAAGGGGGGSVSGLYWAPPAVAHPDDEEFDGDLSAWTAGGTEIAGGVDPGLSFDGAAGDFRADCNIRPSWLRVQAHRASGDVTAFSKSVSVTGDFVAWTRVACLWRDTAANDDAMLGFFLTTSGGDLALIYINKSSHPTIRGRTIVGGVSTLTASLNTSNHPSMQFPLLAIQRLGSIATFWAGTETGAWLPIASQSVPTDPIATVGLLAANAVSTLPNSVVCFDFLRFVATNKWPL